MLKWLHLDCFSIGRRLCVIVIWLCRENPMTGVKRIIIIWICLFVFFYCPCENVHATMWGHTCCLVMILVLLELLRYSPVNLTKVYMPARSYPYIHAVWNKIHFVVFYVSALFLIMISSHKKCPSQTDAFIYVGGDVPTISLLLFFPLPPG